MRETELDRSISGLSRALVQPGLSMEDIAAITLDYAKQLTGSEHGFVSNIDPVTRDAIAK